MIIGGGGERLLVSPVSPSQADFLKQLKCGTTGMLRGLRDPVSFSRRLGDVVVNRVRFRAKVAERLVFVRAVYREVAWSPTDREYDVTYRLTPGTNINYASGYISIPLIQAPMLQ